mgnify:CR=1 FL=1
MGLFDVFLWLDQRFYQECSTKVIEDETEKVDKQFQLEFQQDFFLYLGKIILNFI